MAPTAKRVHAAHADAWEVEGRARARYGGGSARVRGARLMAGGIPDARWNNADIEAADADLDAVVAWYGSRAVPWGVRVPLHFTVDLGTPLFVKRCFALLPADLTDSEGEGEGEVDAEVRLGRVDRHRLARFVAAEAAVFGTSAEDASRWIAPVFGAPGFSHWVAERDGRPLAVATTVASAGDAGPALMLTGLGALLGTDPGVGADLARAAILAGLDDTPDAMLHTYGDPQDDPAVYRRFGFTEVEGLQVRVVHDRSATGLPGPSAP
jgi:hypothetical protein